MHEKILHPNNVHFHWNFSGVKCTDLQEHTIVEFAGDVFDEWIISK